MRRSSADWSSSFAALAFSLACSVCPAQAPPQFETPVSNGLAVSADGDRLLVVNTPDHRVAWFSLQRGERPVLLREVEVALEPVAVALTGPDEAWVACHLSDAVCVVDLRDGVVRRTLPCGDEPSGVCVAGGRVFVTCATRRELAVFDAATRARVATVPLFADEPRSLLASADGSKVWVASHASGNRTTVLPPFVAPAQPLPDNPLLPAPPFVGKIIDADDPAWLALHDVVLPDYDVFEVDAQTLAVRRRYRGVGTTLFGMAERPADHSLWVANTEARNLVAFEPALRGHVVDSRVTRIDAAAAGAVTAFDCNAAVDYAALPDPAARAIALAQPTDVVFGGGGDELFVAAFGSDRVGVLDADSGAVIDRIEIGGGAPTRAMRGPRALAMSADGAHLYVLNRLANTLSVVDVAARQEVGEYSLVFDPTPATIRQGRGFLFDARLSGNGTASCAVCHVDGGTDGLAWDLGDPAGDLAYVGSVFGQEPVHPMKGPLLTQSLVGIDGFTPLHWRGDRASFADFNGTFDSLLGGDELPAADLAALDAFVRSLVYPANPNQRLDRSYATTPAGESAAEGHALFTQALLGSPPVQCATCHVAYGGSNGLILDAGTLDTTQPFKVAQLRNLYQRDGRRVVAGLRTSGYGLSHDGLVDDTFAFAGISTAPTLGNDEPKRRQIAAFLLAFDTGTAPAVGHALTVDVNNRADPAVLQQLATLLARAGLGDCGVAAFGLLDGERRGFAYDTQLGAFVPDVAGAPARSPAALLAMLAVPSAALTFVGVPPGQQARVAIDRDGDGALDGDEGAVRFGHGVAGCGHRIWCSSPATRGSDQFSFVADGAAPGHPGLFVIGFDPASGAALGVDVLVDAAGAVAVPVIADARGAAAHVLPLPDQSSVVGQQLCAQALFADACGPHGLAATGGVRVVIGAK